MKEMEINKERDSRTLKAKQRLVEKEMAVSGMEDNHQPTIPKQQIGQKTHDPQRKDNPHQFKNKNGVVGNKSTQFVLKEKGEMESKRQTKTGILFLKENKFHSTPKDLR